MADEIIVVRRSRPQRFLSLAGGEVHGENLLLNQRKSFLPGSVVVLITMRWVERIHPSSEDFRQWQILLSRREKPPCELRCIPRESGHGLLTYQQRIKPMPREQEAEGGTGIASTVRPDFFRQAEGLFLTRFFLVF